MKKLLWRTLRAIARHYRLKRVNPQCPRKLAEWVEDRRELTGCALTDCQKEANQKLSGKCACGRYTHD